MGFPSCIVPVIVEVKLHLELPLLFKTPFLHFLLILDHSWGVICEFKFKILIQKRLTMYKRSKYLSYL